MKLAVFVPLLLILLVQLKDTDGFWRGRTARVFVDCGRGLRGDGWWSRTDAYVKVRVGFSTMKTRVIHNNNNPIWRRTFFFRRAISSWVRVEVWDKDIRYDDRLGTCWFRIRRGARNRSYTCKLRRGWVRIKYTY